MVQGQQPIPWTTTQIPSEVGRRTNGPLGLSLLSRAFQPSPPRRSGTAYAEHPATKDTFSYAHQSPTATRTRQKTRRRPSAQATQHFSQGFKPSKTRDRHTSRYYEEEATRG
ncbi:hypothetical protein SMAC4_13991 [Sordaria macrospora]|uniref:uncharacterized protein n=1 Tax=Sordaria macrospora TaxID=5147 RepID=UPI002B323A01|nr:hypothetical protein SMAC4_13991 [Sordaria macrospora]